MSILEALLGGTIAGTEYITGQRNAEAAANNEENRDKKNFKKDILKALIIQSMKPKSKDFDWDEIANGEDLTGVIDDDFLNRVSKAMNKNRSNKIGPEIFKNPFNQNPANQPPTSQVNTGYKVTLE